MFYLHLIYLNSFFINIQFGKDFLYNIRRFHKKRYTNADFYVTSGHRIMINGKEVKARDILQGKKVNIIPQKIYTICTEKRIPIKINGLDVITWDCYQKI